MRLLYRSLFVLTLAALSLGPSFAHVLEAPPRLTIWSPELWREATVFNGQFQLFATIGGPLRIPGAYDGSKTTFLVNYAGGRSNNLVDQYATVPTESMRAGDFSSLTAGPIDPSTGTPFFGGQIQPSRLDPSTLALLNRSRAAGAHIGQLCEQIYRVDREPGVRRILGVIALAKKYGAVAVDDAAKAALELGAPNYRFLRRYLDRRPSPPLTLRQVDPLIRQLSLYRDLIQRKAGEST